jgi:SpoVK/Ycf46/Vps4 family AAA+-type ATPase
VGAPPSSQLLPENMFMAKAKKLAPVDPTLAALPAWGQKLAEHYYTRTVSTFLLHGAVRDLQPSTDAAGKRCFVPLKQFLADELFGGRDHVLFYDRSSGIRAATPESQGDFLRALSGFDSMYGTEMAKAPPKDPSRALQVLENYLRLRIADGKSLALVIDFAETIAPGGDLSSMGEADRFALVTLVKWAQDPQFLAANLSICLIVENLAELAPRLARNPYAAQIEITLPTEDERSDYLSTRLGDRKLSEVSEVPIAVLAKLTAGLSRIHLDRLLTEAIERGHRITTDSVKLRKRDMIQAEALGLLEIIEPRFNLDVVAGHEKAKSMLRASASALKKGKTDVLPMGYLIGGPVGTGKTFMATCFAGEIGIPCVKFLNFRSQWQGVTEGNLEKIFNLLKAMWPVAVIIDEADAFLGNRGSSGDSGTSARVFSQIASFMGNTEYRGKIVWFLLTCRPDLLPIDLKRQGRAEEHLALFYPQTAPERDELFRVVARKANVNVSKVGTFSALVPATSPSMSGADIEAALVRAKFRAVASGRDNVLDEDVTHVLADFIPPSYPLEIELQNLVAVQECTSRELIPDAYKAMPREEMTRRINEIKLLLGDR